MLTIILAVEYDGTDYFGWQLQADKRTVQGELNRAVQKAFCKNYQIIGSGRTDTGVHSSGQIAHFVCDEEPKIPRHKVKLAINQKLPKNIRVRNLWFSELDFHSRFDAIMREYKYRFCRRPSVFSQRWTAAITYQLDVELLYESANLFLGQHNFLTFSKTNSTNSDYVCNVKKCEWTRQANGIYELTIIADRYVYGMVRALVGAMVDVARHWRTLQDIEFAIYTQDRTLKSALAPATGLNLHRIYYKEPFNDIIS
ncbi:MAG: tRNA pseudouridine(38-40) synthase TruA [Ignavibacteria bacterium]|jgi:tRNA pseudouridine38-40 synthase|nr:tRNA pseudouridine(38-40) synthase TruA [Ignavibacteria bacterium]